MTEGQAHPPRFAADLYRGAAAAYDGFRLTYPAPMIEDLLRRVRPSGHGRLLDLACGTGQLSFALGHAFAEVWAVDREPDMVRVVTSKSRGSRPVRTVVSDAEVLDAPADSFELITIGNAFHRLDRTTVAGKSFQWLRPGGHVALCWSDPPWAGAQEWQQVLDHILTRWTERLDAGSRTPAGWEQERQQRPDVQVMADAGFIRLGRSSFAVQHRWSVGELAGFVYSTSFLPASVLGEHAATFETDLAERLRQAGDARELNQMVSFAYDLFRRPCAGESDVRGGPIIRAKTGPTRIT